MNEFLSHAGYCPRRSSAAAEAAPYSARPATRNATSEVLMMVGGEVYRSRGHETSGSPTLERRRRMPRVRPGPKPPSLARLSCGCEQVPGWRTAGGGVLMTSQTRAMSLVARTALILAGLLPAI